MLTSEHVFRLTDHACVQCMARILERPDGAGGVVYVCSNCGNEAPGLAGETHPSNCMCGAKLGNRDAFLGCVRNPNPRADLRSLILVCEAA